MNTRFLLKIFIAVFISSFLLTPAYSVSDAVQKDEKGIVLTFMNTMNDEENETLIQLVKEFNQKNPQIKVQVENISFYDAKNHLEKKFKEGCLPDIMRVEIRLVAPFARSGMFRELDSFVATGDYVDYLPYLYKFSVVDQHFYAVPQVADCLIFLYNKSQLKEAGFPEAPKTIEQFLKCAQKLTIDEDGNTGDSTLFNQYKIARFGFSYHFESYYLLPFVFSFGGNVCDEAGKPLLKSEKTKSAFRFIYDLKSKYNVVPSKIDPKFGHDFTLMEFMDGRASMIIDGPWNIRKLLKGSAFANDKSNLGVATIPRKEVSGSPIGGQYLAISAKCEHPAEAYAFINFINSKEAQIRFGKQNYLIPTRKSAMDEIQKDTAEPDHSIRSALFDQMKFAALYAFNIPEPQYTDEMNKTTEKLLNGQLGFDEALDKMTSRFNELSSGKK